MSTVDNSGQNTNYNDYSQQNIEQAGEHGDVQTGKNVNKGSAKVAQQDSIQDVSIKEFESLIAETKSKFTELQQRTQLEDIKADQKVDTATTPKLSQPVTKEDVENAMKEFKANYDKDPGNVGSWIGNAYVVVAMALAYALTELEKLNNKVETNIQTTNSLASRDQAKLSSETMVNGAEAQYSHAQNAAITSGISAGVSGMAALGHASAMKNLNTNAAGKTGEELKLVTEAHSSKTQILTSTSTMGTQGLGAIGEQQKAQGELEKTQADAQSKLIDDQQRNQEQQRDEASKAKDQSKVMDMVQSIQEATRKAHSSFSTSTHGGA